ncbi:hypothetical protein MNBD_GAMMA09-1161 [hydrothermal vent metagenome]|uniref:Uncharacterized protein n=1 Tax=hydrothermal vent metagenome TaxID=652676 RepID=A0A3B0XPY1_9ZZZZ
MELICFIFGSLFRVIFGEFMSGIRLCNENLQALIDCSQFIVHVKKLQSDLNSALNARFLVVANLGVRGFIAEGEEIEVAAAVVTDDAGGGKWGMQSVYMPSVHLSQVDELILFLNKGASKGLEKNSANYVFSMTDAYEDISFKAAISGEPVVAERESPESIRLTLSGDEGFSFEGLLLRVQSVMFEDILECPGQEVNMPAGSGVVVSLHVTFETAVADLYLNELSHPYESTDFVIWNDFKITLLEVEGYNKPIVHLKVDALSRG